MRILGVWQIILSKRRGRLGISCIDNPDGPGAIVSGLISGSVAYAAGISVGDSILAVNGEDLSGHQQCIAAIDAAPDRIAFVLSRTPAPRHATSRAPTPRKILVCTKSNRTPF